MRPAAIGDPTSGSQLAPGCASQRSASRIHARGNRQTAHLVSPQDGRSASQGRHVGPQCRLASLAQRRTEAILEPIKRQEALTEQPAESEQSIGAQSGPGCGLVESDKGLPPLRILLVWDNLAGHLSHELMGWLFQQGVMPLYTPIRGPGSTWRSRCSISL